MGVVLGGSAFHVGRYFVVHGNDIVCGELVLTIQGDGSLQQVHQQGAVGFGTQLVYNGAHILVNVSGIGAAVIDHVLTFIVHDIQFLFGIGGHTLVLQGQDGVHNGLTVRCILGLVVQTGHERGTMNEHVL